MVGIVTGSVGSVTGRVGSVTGRVGSVTGRDGRETGSDGNVMGSDGNVIGSDVDDDAGVAVAANVLPGPGSRRFSRPAAEPRTLHFGNPYVPGVFLPAGGVAVSFV